MQNLQGVEQLPFVFVQTFNLYIENRIGIDGNAVCLFDISGKTLLVGVLDLKQIVQHFVVTFEPHQIFQLVGVFQESAINTNLTKLIFDQHQLLPRKYLIDHLLDKCGLPRSQKARDNVYLCHLYLPLF